MRLIEPKTKADFDRYYDLRWRILRMPWGEPLGSERDGLDGSSIHLMACDDDDRLLGVCRLHFNSPGEAQIRFMAVDEDCRNAGAGSALLAWVESKARQQGAERIVLNARESAVPFYLKRGYAVAGEGETLFGVIRHFRMGKNFR
jgi:predicted GNAT family N-acyltransferase